MKKIWVKNDQVLDLVERDLRRWIKIRLEERIHIIWQKFRSSNSYLTYNVGFLSSEDFIEQPSGLITCCLYQLYNIHYFHTSLFLWTLFSSLTRF